MRTAGRDRHRARMRQAGRGGGRVLLVAALTMGAWATPLARDAFATEAALAVMATTVNDVPAGDAVVMMTEDDVLVEASALDRAGLRSPATSVRRIDDRSFVSLRSLEPDVRFDIDHTQLVLHVKAAPALLGTTVVPARRPAGPPPVAGSRSAFLNYAVNWRERGGIDLFGEAGITLKRAVVTTTFFDTGAGRVVRGLSQAVIDDRRRLARWTIGDRVVSGGELGGAVLLGGVAVSREYGIDPGFVNYSTVQFAGTAAAPSIVEVYANGQLVDTHRLPAGQFELKGLPVSTGRGEARVVVRDMFGRRQEYGLPYYVTSAVLAKGLHDYAYGVGIEREQLGATSWGYARPAALARHRVGLTDSLTTGVRAEVSPRLISGGPSMSWRFGFGEVELALAASRHTEHGGGAAGLAGYRYVGRRVNLGGVVRSIGRSYRTLGSRFDTRFAVREAELSAAARITSAITVAVRRTQTSEGGGRSSLTISSRVAPRTNVVVTVDREPRAHGGTRVGVGLTRVLGRRTGAHVSYDARARARSAASAEIARSLPVGHGLGYRLRWHDSPTPQANGVVEYQGSAGRYDASFGTSGAGGGMGLSASGAIVAIGGGVHATRTVQDAYALVRVPGTPGIRVYASQQEIGRTDKNGELLLPNLLSYSSNELAIADEDVPLSNTIDRAEGLVVPGYRGAAIVEFPVRDTKPTTGRIEVATEDGVMVPFAGQLTLHAAGRRFSSPIGRDGNFYLEQVPAGDHAASIEWNGRRCQLTLPVDAAGGDLGLVRCVASGSRR